ncbi:MAG: carbohydrate ABC transporter permease [Bacilli bacterium]|jgi:multiple sugar transport system permease protein
MTNKTEKKLARKERIEELKAQAIETYEKIRADLKNPVRKAVRARKVSLASSRLIRFVVIFGLSFVIIFPLFQQLTLALRHPNDINDPLIVWIPETFSFLNFKIAGTMLNYWRALWNNIKVSSIVMVLQIASTALAGYAFSKLRFKGSEVLFWIVMITLIVPPQTLAIPKLVFFNNFDIFGIIKLIKGSGLKLTGVGKTSSFYIMAATGQGIRAALFIYLFKQFFRGLPVELDESAQIDGAGVFRTFWSVMLPNARGVMITVGLFAFVWQWNDVYFTRLFEVSDTAYPLLTAQLSQITERLPHYLKTYGMDSLVSEDLRGNEYFVSLISHTAAFLMMLPLLIGYLFVQRHFVEGIERTGIVG